MSVVCQDIKCPFFNPSPSSIGGYGCQRYSTSDACHLKAIVPDLRSNDYALSLDNDRLLVMLKEQNDRFFAEDNYYSQQKRFFQMFPELKACSFVPGENL